MPPQNDKDWIDYLTEAAGSLGFNKVRVRWKLTKWRDGWIKFGDKLSRRFTQVRYEHRICPACGNIQDRSHKVCDSCGARLLPRPLEILRRCGLLLPEFVTPTTVLITAILAQYYRTAIYSGVNFVSPGTAALMHYGANFPPAVWGGDWWRVATCVFLHAGALHILFNLLALKQICPAVEEVFGRGRTLFFFMLTGILAGIGSAWFRSSGVGIGASGAIMGLVGLAAGWGHRDGGLAGRTVRDSMLQWGLYTLVFGYMVGADNVAHFVGFASGFGIGAFSRPIRDKRLSPYISFIEGALGIVLFLVTVALGHFPPRSVMDVVFGKVTSAKILACGETIGTTPNSIDADTSANTVTHEGDPGFPKFSSDCEHVKAKLGTSFGMQVMYEGEPADSSAILLARITHPPIHDPQTDTTVSLDEWEIGVEIGYSRFVGWGFEYPWEIQPGEWKLQVVEEGEEGGEDRVLAEKTFRVEVDPESTVEASPVPTASR